MSPFAKRCFLLMGVLAGVWSLATAQDNTTVLVPEVLNVYPHDPSAFTQGLLWHEGFLYESTGLRGQSSLRRVDVETGEILALRPVNRPPEQLTGANALPDYFAEGLERVGDTLIQLTWTEGEAFIYDLATLEQIGLFTYDGQGWGLCYDGRYLFMSDSTGYLDVREAETFDLIVSMAVTLNGSLLQANLLNELECVGDHIYANLWRTDYIVKINKLNGVIEAVIDASTLLPTDEKSALQARNGDAVLNGIAYNPQTDTFYLTGKNWDKLFEVRFVLQQGQ